MAIKELSVQYACKIAQGLLNEKKTNKKTKNKTKSGHFCRGTFVQNTNYRAHLNVPAASIIQQGGNEESNAADDIKVNSIGFK